MTTWRATVLGLALLLLASVGAACSQDSAEPSDRSPTHTPSADTNSSSSPSYIALGDSLSVGIGASNPGANGFVALVHQDLDVEYELLNLGHGGDTSHDLLNHEHLDEAISAIKDLNHDGNDDNDVVLVTLEIGGNDLLGLYFSSVITGVCPDAATALSKAECREPLAATLAEFDANLAEALDRLLEADPALSIMVLTLYDPFSGLLPSVSGVAGVALEGVAESQIPDGLNGIIRKHAEARNISVAEVYEPFLDRARELMSADFIHPNDAGYRVMADAVIAALEHVSQP